MRNDREEAFNEWFSDNRVDLEGEYVELHPDEFMEYAKEQYDIADDIEKTERTIWRNKICH